MKLQLERFLFGPNVSGVHTVPGGCSFHQHAPITLTPSGGCIVYALWIKVSSYIFQTMRPFLLQMVEEIIGLIESWPREVLRL